ncbi:DUF4279 domain-containing protein, partial [Gemmatimonadota bacterium]
MLSEFHESTIVEVKAAFGFFDFECEPSMITETLGMEPDSAFQKGESFLLRGGKTSQRLHSSWTVSSASESKDVNEHLRQLLSRLEGTQGLFRTEFGVPAFYITWKGSYLYAGSGPFYEVDVLKGIARFGAE